MSWSDDSFFNLCDNRQLTINTRNHSETRTLTTNTASQDVPKKVPFLVDSPVQLSFGWSRGRWNPNKQARSPKKRKPSFHYREQILTNSFHFFTELRKSGLGLSNSPRNSSQPLVDGHFQVESQTNIDENVLEVRPITHAHTSIFTSKQTNERKKE